jgi:hypothetical protein
MVLHTFKLRADSNTNDLEMLIERIKKLGKKDKVLVKRGGRILLPGKRLRRDEAVAGFEQMVRVLRAVEEDGREVLTVQEQDSEREQAFPRILPGGSRWRNECRRLQSTCWTCGARRYEKQSDFKCCAKCNCACYCSSGCQRADWGGHKKVCKKLDRLKSLDKGAKIQILTLQLSVGAIPDPQPTIYLITYALGEGPGRVRAEACQFMCTSPPGYEECIRRAFPMLPTGEPVFKFGGDMCGKSVFVTLSGKVIIYKKGWGEF